MTLNLTLQRKARVLSLTPMIDVVFLLLVFFMLAARFDQTAVVPVALATGTSDYSGPPRLIDVRAEAVSLNGVRIEQSALSAALQPLMADPSDMIILRARDGASVQRLLDVMTILRREGFSALTLIE